MLDAKKFVGSNQFVKMVSGEIVLRVVNPHRVSISAHNVLLGGGDTRRR